VRDVQVRTHCVLSASKELIYLIFSMISALKLAPLAMSPSMESALSVRRHVLPALGSLKTVRLVMGQAERNSFINRSVGKIVPQVQALTLLV
jgi:hypothetical protein